VVASITDGDTVRFNPPLLGSTSLRFLNIDAPESGGDTQEPWASASRAHLQQLLPPSSEIAIETDQERTDSFGRVLGHAVRTDGVNANREQLRLGHAALYVIWPNMAHFVDYRSAQIEAQRAGRGVWSGAAPLREQPFEYRLRQDRAPPFRPVGDFFTRFYVEPPDYARVHVNNRVFFNTRADADAAGYRPCARDAARAYSTACFTAADDRQGLSAEPRVRNPEVICQCSRGPTPARARSAASRLARAAGAVPSPDAYSSSPVLRRPCFVSER
jgi:endonuclease YncB( thermonuclease family)